MPRTLRHVFPGIPHHAIQRGNNRQPVFLDLQDRLYFLDLLKDQGKQYQTRLGAYCLMTNHIHLMIYPESRDGLINFMKMVAQLYSQRVNRKYKRTGKLWENRYKIHIVDPGCAWVLARYIELNPVRADMVSQPQDYQYSSARAHWFGIQDKVLTEDILFGDRAGYKQYLTSGEAFSSKHLQEIRTATQQQKVYGAPSFKKTIEQRFGVDMTVRRRGRPGNLK